MTENIWIIGASTGIGAALAKAYEAMGANLALSARKAIENSKHIILPLDVMQLAEIEAARDLLMQRWDKIDRVILMVGAYQPMQFGRLDLKVVHDIIHTNLLGTFKVTEALVTLLARDKAQFAICASVAGYCGLPNGQPYAATKAGVISLTESLRAEYDGVIDVRLINPGFVATRLTDKNTFEMPFIIDADLAAAHIVKGLNTSNFEIHFPKKFTYAIKLFSNLPYFVFNKLNSLIKKT